MSKVLIVYYSRSGENYFDGGMKVLDRGNTEIGAEMIQAAIGADLFRIETVNSYPAGYRDCCNQAVAEWKGNARPEIVAYAGDMEQYDTVFVGYPIWCGTMPMCLYTFLEHYDLTGKKIIPFCTHEGSGFGQSREALARLCPGATIGEGLAVKGCLVRQSGEKIAAWAKCCL